VKASPLKARRGSRPAPGFGELAHAALERLLEGAEPADVCLRRFFGAHPSMGRNDRGRLAEAAWDILRNRRLYAHLAQTGRGSLAARLLAVHAARERIEADVLPRAIRLSLPDWLDDRLAAQLAPDELERLGAALLLPAPLDLRVNLLRTDVAGARAALAAEGIAAEPVPLAPLALRVEGKPALERTRAFREGLVEVQDAGSQLLAHLVAPRRGQTVVDFCAGAGGKTLALAALLRGSGQVFACDVSATRLARMRERLSRSGASNVQPFGIDSEHDRKLDRLAGRADAVLVDAPCSGTGTLRRNPDLKWRFDPVSLTALGATQRSILAAAARLVRPGGVLVYATCSLLAEENEAVREDFEREHPAWELQGAGECLAGQGVVLAEPSARVLALRPDRDRTDGFYAVRWRSPR
jgi:16S rRNA (cytosine967-C5)-methyltransferase